MSTRVLALWSPDWPVTAAALAAHVPPYRPAAVFVANRVLACSAVARAYGIRRGLRRREAQARCPDLAVLTPDADRDARAFEPVVVAVEELAPGVEIVRPGLVALPAKGPVGWFGGEQAAAERLVDQVAARTGVECQVGLADGLFAAVLAARRGVAVAPGHTPAFLAPLGVEELDREPDVDRSELVGLLHRLGLRSLGAFGGLDAQDVASRFGADAVLGHRLARGLDPRPPVRRRPPEELTVGIELDPPVDRVDAAAFAARGLAERLHTTLAGHGLSCTRLGVAARTAAGEELHRVWRCAEPLTPAGTVDRVRWQLDAWLTRGNSGAVTRLWLVPEETVTAGALQLGLWGEVGEADERAGRALVRVQALLGPESVVTAVLAGGRDPAERVRLVPWGDDREEPPARHPRRPAGGAALMIGSSARAAAVDAVDGPQPVITNGLTGSPDGSPGVITGPAPAAVPGPAGGPHMAITDEPGPRRAPAGWPEDVVRRSGRVSVAAAGAARSSRSPTGATPEPGTPRSTNRRRRVPTRRSTPRSGGPEPSAEWPGRLPAPSPATVPPQPWPVELLDADGEPVRLASPDLLVTSPSQLRVDAAPGTGSATTGASPRAVEAWAGPWPSRQRWWVPGAVPSSRLQLLCDTGDAYLLTIIEGRWWLTGIYD